jgi:ATP-binding cassette subfamily B protein
LGLGYVPENRDIFPGLTVRQSGRQILDGIELSIEKGETVAFVGPSGAGKTTLCSLLPRFYDVSSGRITVDGHDIRDLTLSSLRRQIGIVQQDVFCSEGLCARISCTEIW